MEVAVTPAVQVADSQTATQAQAKYDNDTILELREAGHEPERQVPADCVTIEEDEFPEGGRDAWLVVFGAFMLLFPSFGFMVSIGTLQEYWHAHQLANYTVRDVGWIPSVLGKSFTNLYSR